MRKVASAADFIWSENPLEVLGTVTSISFDDEASLPLKEHHLTTEEVLSLIFHVFTKSRIYDLYMLLTYAISGDR